MAVEIFDEDAVPSTSIHIVVYNNKNHLIPSWWLELPVSDDDDFYNLNEIQSILNCLPSIKKQLESILEYFE